MVGRAKRSIVFWTFSLFHFIHYLLFFCWKLKMENYPSATACKPANVTKKEPEKNGNGFFLFACVRFWAANWNRHGNRTKSLKRNVILFYFRFHCHRFWFTYVFFFVAIFYSSHGKRFSHVRPWSKSHVRLCTDSRAKQFRTTIEIDCSYIIRTMKCQVLNSIEREPITTTSK